MWPPHENIASSAPVHDISLRNVDKIDHNSIYFNDYQIE